MIVQHQQMSREIVIDAARTVEFMGPDVRVYGTPNMVSDVEMLCRDMLLQKLEPGQDSIGIRVSIDHLGPAIVGDRITVHATVKVVDGRRVSFDTTITRGDKIIGLMLHIRTVVSVADLKLRLATV